MRVGHDLFYTKHELKFASTASLAVKYTPSNNSPRILMTFSRNFSPVFVVIGSKT